VFELKKSQLQVKVQHWILSVGTLEHGLEKLRSPIQFQYIQPQFQVSDLVLKDQGDTRIALKWES
jgi:hypothetical protein